MGWHRVNKSESCYGCGKPDFCRYSDEGGVECKRGPFPGSRECNDKNGVPHWLGNRGDEEWKPPEKPVQIQSSAKPATPAQVHEAYQAVVDHLHLGVPHWKALKARGFTRDSSVAYSFRTLASPARIEMAREVAEQCPFWASVPGFFLNTNGRATLAGMNGLLIPCRGLEGKIHALRVRPDQPGTGGKYRWISSAERGGTGPTCLESYWEPVGVEHNRERLRVTEGELKAARIAQGTGVATISAPGVQSLASDTVLKWIKELDPKLLLLCPDRDMRENPVVARAVVAAIRRLQTLDIPMKVETW